VIATLEKLALDRWEDIAAGRARPSRFHIAKLSHEQYPPEVSPLVFLLFPDRAARPAAVAKVARVAAGDAAIETEARALENVRRSLPSPLRDQVPRPFGGGTLNGRAYLLETALAGEVELHHTWGARGARRSRSRIRAALEWIGQAQAATASSSVRASDWLAPSPDEILRGLERLGCGGEALARFSRLVPELATTQWPGALVHGDFFPGNVLFGRASSSAAGWRDIAVVDWMLAESCAPSFVDVVTYELSFSTQAVHSGRRPTADEIRAVHDLEPFAAARAGWRQRGVDIGLGSLARFATMAHAALRDGDPAAGRGRIGSTWARLLEFELEMF